MKPLAALLLPLVVAASSVHAAPATSEELTSTTESRSLGTASGNSTASPAPAAVVMPGTQSKTVELLLQLQDQPNTLGKDPGNADPSRRGAASPSATGAAPKPGTAVPEDNPLQALKSAILRDASPRQTASETGTSSTSGATETDRRTPAAGSSGQSSSASSEPKESLLAHPVVRFIRENRTLIVLVSLAALAAVWLTANFSMRGSR